MSNWKNDTNLEVRISLTAGLNFSHCIIILVWVITHNLEVRTHNKQLKQLKFRWLHTHIIHKIPKISNLKNYNNLEVRILTAGLTFLTTLLSTALFLSKFFADNANNSSMLYVTKRITKLLIISSQICIRKYKMIQRLTIKRSTSSKVFIYIQHKIWKFISEGPQVSMYLSIRTK